MTEKTIQDLIAESGLLPSDIVKLSKNRIRMNQASLWLREVKFSLPTEIMLEYMCNEKLNGGVEVKKSGRPKNDAGFSGKKVENKLVIPPNAILQTIREKKNFRDGKSTTERPDADPSIPVATTCRYSGKEMAYKKGSALNIPALFLTIGGQGYLLRDANAKSFSVNGKLYRVSEFEEVE